MIYYSEQLFSLLGFKDNPYPYIAGCDIFVISSHYEGYPVVLVEAMTLGKRRCCPNQPANHDFPSPK
ncbi:glycosyltransferase [Aeromonas salmonicida]|uniref:glycosyltransferase n=1 Tax=Aeromonas salmonicida TaxID=645 RepID=UPI001F39D4A9|nr:glycosyltransferase [Aeromonas salmonicida]